MARFLLVGLLGLLSIQPAVSQELPHLRRQGDATQLVVDGQAYVAAQSVMGWIFGMPIFSTSHATMYAKLNIAKIGM